MLPTPARSAGEIVKQLRGCRPTKLHLVDAPLPRTYERRRKELPGIDIVQVIHMRGEEAVGEALRVAPLVAMLLLDSGIPALAVKERGGSGRVHDGSVGRRIRDS